MNRTRTATALAALLVSSVAVSGAAALAAPAKPGGAGKTKTTATAAPTPTASAATVEPATSATSAPAPAVTTAAPAPVETTVAPVETAASAVEPSAVPVETVAAAAAETTVSVVEPVAAPLTAATVALEQAATALLTRPVLVAPLTKTITPATGSFTLPADRDYVVTIQPGAVFTSPITINGGHNVVLENASIQYAAPAGAPSTLFRGLMLKNQTGTMYVNGLKLGGPLTEGIDLDEKAPGAAVVLRNITVGKITGTFDTNHADLLQTWAGPDKLVVDGFTGVSDYQGFMLKPNDEWADGPAPSFFSLRNVTIDVTTGFYALWTVANRAFPLTTTNVTVKPNPAKPSRDSWLWPKPSTGDTTWTSVLGLL